MRGKAPTAFCKFPATGITPAYAGKSVRQLRTCGSGQRITPAYAGKRSSRHSAMHRKQDHPRLCGEKPTIKRRLQYPRGSPPPMRGKVEVMQIMTDLTRITPAYAGKSIGSLLRVASHRDHPRLCGEKSIGLTAHGTC